MSFQAMTWAVDQKTGSPTRKAVLLALANRLNHDSGVCFPSIVTICGETELSDRAVRDALKDLAAAGLIERNRKRKENGHLGGYTYSFPVFSPAAPPAGSPAAPGAAQEQELEPPNQTLAAAPRETKQNVVWDALASVCGYTPETPSAKGDFGKTVSQIRAVIPEAATLEECAQAMSVRRARFHQRFPDATFTHRVLRMRWDELGAGTAPAGEGTRRVTADDDLEDDGTGRRTF